MERVPWNSTEITFITPFGNFRYARVPQNFVSSGVSYNRCFAAILSILIFKYNIYIYMTEKKDVLMTPFIVFRIRVPLVAKHRFSVKSW